MKYVAPGVLVLWLTACGVETPANHRILGGDEEKGLAAVRAYGCVTCHRIPGASGLGGAVGPPLEEFGRRSYLAGVFPNEPQYLVRWLQNPPAMRPDTAMPDMNVGEADARNMAAYLYTLR